MEMQQKEYSQRPRKELGAFRLLLGGILGLVIAMGIGRFAFTPILPLMQRDLGMSHSVAGWLAGMNYLGYLVGAIFCSATSRVLSSRYVTVSTLLLSIATTMAMGLTKSVFWWGTFRFTGGVVSAVLFIIISAGVSEALFRRGYSQWMGILYGGVGAGIALSGFTIPWLDQIGSWTGAWIGMGVLAAALAVIGVALTKGKIDRQKIQSGQTKPSKSLQRLWPLVGAYFFEGLGYIVTATFIVAIVAKTPALEAYAAYSWVAVGLAAVPSTVLWPLFARRFGRQNALLAAYVIQATGILISVYADTGIEIMFAAVLFGGTFMGITALMLAEGNLRAGQDGRRATAILTASFGVGQILGPILAGFLSDQQGGFTLALLLAACSVVIGSIFIFTDRYFADHKQQKGESLCRT